MTKLELEKLVAELEAKLASKVPVCPHCKAEMEAVEFEGYYDNFDYWSCDCETIPAKNKRESRGAYA